MRPPSALLLALCLLAAGADAGHELPFYPSYYPQEIRIDTLEPAAAATLLAQNSLHAYVGADPFAGGAAPPTVTAVDSLGGFLVVTFNTGLPAWRERDTRCAAARRILAILARSSGRYVFHPYPVTPYHGDYLEHVDRAEAAKREAAARPDPATTRPLRVRAKGPAAEALARAHWRPEAGEWDATLEDVDVADLLAAGATSLNGWLGPPPLKQGWFHAYLLHAGALADPATRQAAETLYRRLLGGDEASPVDRLNLERRLVSLLGRGCERVVVGYAPRREYFNSEFSAGVENVAWDSVTGLDSAIFLRTVKLKDFPWNGWLRLGIGTSATAAWNPIGGFTDPAGTLVWLATGDPAFFPAPYAGGWIGNRVTAASVSTAPSVEVPNDALRPEPGTGLLREVGGGTTARTKVVYRVLTSAFHDGSRMTTADVLYPYVFAYRWGVSSSRTPLEYDPGVDAATALTRQWLAGLRVLRVDTEVREYGDVKFTYVVHTVEAYARHGGSDPETIAAVAPPWSTLPWPVIVLMEEAVKRGLAAFSADEARRRGVPWLDLVRDRKTKAALATLVDAFALQGYVPPGLKASGAGLKGIVTPGDARERWSALKHFYQKHGHFLVTNGPYRLDSWSETDAVLQVFRDFTYPLGVGSYDRYAIPRRAFVARVEARGERLEVHAEVETIQKFQREHRLVRTPVPAVVSAGDRRDVPVCRYVVRGADGEVHAAGTAPYPDAGVFTVDLAGKLKPGPYTVAIALYAAENAVNPEIRELSYRAPARP